MTSLIDQLSQDKVWETLSPALAGRTRRTSNRGFVNLNCPVCVQTQSRPDTKERCSVKYDEEGIGVNCFNCGLKLRFKRGHLLSKGMENFLLSLGIPEQKVKELYFWSWEVRSLIDSSSVEIKRKIDFTETGFRSVALPDGAKLVLDLANEGCTNKDFLQCIEYLFSRGDDITTATDYYWTPDTKNNMHKRLIVPFYYENRIVGWTGRSTTEAVNPKYFNKSPEGFLFNSAVMKKRDRKFLIITEGIFDALALDCVSTEGNSLNEQQINWINSSHQTKIVVPDRDKAGEKFIDYAVENNWHVAFPRSPFNQWWDNDIKDVADAVKRYGRLWTLRSIIATATANPTTIMVQRKQRG